MSNPKRYRPYIIAVLAILAFGTFAPTLAYAAPLATSDKDWQYVNGNSWAWNYSPETQINKNNVNNLEVKWIFPIGGNSLAPPGLTSLKLAEGTTTPPIVAGGKVFVTTNYMRTYAVDAKSGRQLWVNDYSVNMTDIQKRLPVLMPSGPHLHGIRYWQTGNEILISGLACDFYGIDANSGKTAFWVQDLCKDVPGNLYKYYQLGGLSAASSQANIPTYEKGHEFVFVLPGSMHSTAFPGDGRHVTMGIDMTTHQVNWRLYSFPPQGVPTKDWALQECDIGYFLSTPCKDVAAKAPGNLEWDWAQPGQPPSIYGGVTANWGQPIVDEDTGILYTQTGNQGPFTYIGATPGPRLYGSTIMAIDLSTGKRIWWMQPFPRDPYDYDCNWSGILADTPQMGKIYVKGCKEGFLNVLDAKTGRPLERIDVINDQVSTGQITSAALKEPYQGGVRYHLNDIMSTYDIRQMNSPDNSTYCGRPCTVYPYWYNGIFGTDTTYDPTSNTLFHYMNALEVVIKDSPAPKTGGTLSITTGYPNGNTTIAARDLATGKIKWSWYYRTSDQRAAMVATPDMLFTAFTDGYMRFFDKDNGKVLREVNLGSPVVVGVTTGQDSSGNQEIFAVAGATRLAGMPNFGLAGMDLVPGTIVALGLSSNTGGGAAQTTTVTTTSTSATTITTSAPAQTITTSITQIQTQTETSGLPSEVTYAAVAVAIIAIIAAAVLAMRKK